MSKPAVIKRLSPVYPEGPKPSVILLPGDEHYAILYPGHPVANQQPEPPCRFPALSSDAQLDLFIEKIREA